MKSEDKYIFVVRTNVTSGLAGLDAQLGGGIPAGTVHVLIGEPMNAYELFGFHFIGNASGTYVMRGSTERDVQEGIRRVTGKAPAAVLQGPNAKIPKLGQNHRLVIEGFHEVLAAPWDATQKWLQDLRKECQETQSVALLLMTRGLCEKADEIRVSQVVDGSMELGFDRQGFGLYPFLKVTKMRNVPDANRFLLFKETPKGLFMENTRRVF